jgi:hypothetical protein
MSAKQVVSAAIRFISKLSFRQREAWRHHAPHAGHHKAKARKRARLLHQIW